MGKTTDRKLVKVIVVSNYLIIYELIEVDLILILTIWDTRQNPDKIDYLLK